jgi:hypothetical protein
LRLGGRKRGTLSTVVVGGFVGIDAMKVVEVVEIVAAMVALTTCDWCK